MTFSKSLTKQLDVPNAQIMSSINEALNDLHKKDLPAASSLEELEELLNK